MQPPRRSLHLGHLTVKGERFEFQPAKGYTFEAAADEPLEVQVTFAYEEQSMLKEGCCLLLGLTMGRQRYEAVLQEVRDRPVVNDRMGGTLVRALLPLPPGYHKGVFTLEATSTRGPWMGAEEHRRTYFTREDYFTLDVK